MYFSLFAAARFFRQEHGREGHGFSRAEGHESDKFGFPQPSKNREEYDSLKKTLLSRSTSGKGTSLLVPKERKHEGL